MNCFIAFDLDPDGKPEQQHQDRHADAVVEAALQVERLAHDRRHGLICHDCLAECGIGWCKHRRQQCHFQNAERGEHERGCQEAE